MDGSNELAGTIVVDLIDSRRVVMAHAVAPGSAEAKSQFRWTFDGRVIAIDHGASVAASGGLDQLMALGSFAVISFDPAGRLAEKEGLQELDEFQVVSHATLGDGQPATLFACLDPALSGTLEPTAEHLAARGSGNAAGQVDSILARLPINSLRLDDIKGLSSLDWLILDGCHDDLAILEHGSGMLADALLVDAKVPFQPLREGQGDVARVGHWMVRHGFRFYCFHALHSHSAFPMGLELEKGQASITDSATALYLPDDERLAALPINQLMKLSFLLHTVYRSRDMACRVLGMADPKLAREYMVAEGILWPVDETETEFTLSAAYSPDIWVRQRDPEGRAP